MYLKVRVYHIITRYFVRKLKPKQAVYNFVESVYIQRYTKNVCVF